MADAEHRAAYRAALDEIAAVVTKHAAVMSPRFDEDADVVPRDEGTMMPAPVLTRFVLIGDWQSLTDADEWERPLSATSIDRFPLELRQSDVVGLLVRAADSERSIVANCD